ncbi:MAG: hypothetical protein WA996_01700 [Candidatus Promineifilaceae bacterium]
MNSDAKFRLPLMAVVLLTLLAALWAGLYRIGWVLPALRPGLPMAHGPLMISGLLGTVIALERAIAIRERWTYVGPVLTALGAIVLIIDGFNQLGSILIALGSLAFLIVSLVMVYRVPAFYTATMAMGAAAWFIGNTLWLAGWAISEIVYWWAGFLILTIVGERLELSRVARPGRLGHILFAVALGITVAGLILSIIDYSAGVRLASLGFVALALWLFAFDIARRTVRRSGLTRFIAVNLLLGYGWLVIGGLLGMRYAGVIAGPTYDAMLHALFLGFVLSLIFAHAPIIVPAVSGVNVPYHKFFYGPVVLLHLSLAMRIIGDLNLWRSTRLWGGLLNVVAVLGFLLLLAAFALRERRAKRKSLATPPSTDTR